MSELSRSRPLSEEEMAAAVIAIELLMSPRRVLDDTPDVTPAWRFSGRWFGTPQRFD